MELTPEEKDRARLFATDPWSLQSSPARDEVRALCGRLLARVEELEAEKARGKAK